MIFPPLPLTHTYTYTHTPLLPPNFSTSCCCLPDKNRRQPKAAKRKQRKYDGSTIPCPTKLPQLKPPSFLLSPPSSLLLLISLFFSSPASFQSPQSQAQFPLILKQVKAFNSKVRSDFVSRRQNKPQSALTDAMID